MVNIWRQLIRKMRRNKMTDKKKIIIYVCDFDDKMEEFEEK